MIIHDYLLFRGRAYLILLGNSLATPICKVLCAEILFKTRFQSWPFFVYWGKPSGFSITQIFLFTVEETVRDYVPVDSVSMTHDMWGLLMFRSVIAHR